jgi:arylsulfatase A-like enzyme
VAGAGAAAALIVAEVAASLHLGAPLPPRAWAFLAFYWVPAFAIVGAIGALLSRPSLASAALVWLPALAYCFLVATQDLPGGRTGGTPGRLAALLAAVVSLGAAARITESTLARRRVTGMPAHLLRWALMLVVVATVQVGGRQLHGATGSAVLVLPLGVAAAAVLFALALAPAAVRLRPRSAGGIAAVLVAAVALTAAWQAGRPPPGNLHDDAQPAPPSSGTAGSPNVVLIVLDAVRASSLSCYGYERRTTPHLDAFAAGSLRFASATTVSSWSVPAHASLFTGLFAPEHGAGGAQDDARTGLSRPAPLDARFVTLAEALAGRGYATAGVSANPLVAPSMGLSQGFRFFDARPSPRALGPGYRSLLQRLQGVLPPTLLADPLRSTFPSAMRSAAEITDAAFHWLRRRPRGQPYLLFVNYMDAHTPFVLRPGFSGRWPGRSPRLPPNGLPDTVAVMAGRRPLTAEESSHLRALYDDALSYLDHHLGRLLAALDAQPDRERTWIIVTADHGEQLGEHGRLGHDCVLYPQVLRVPLVVRYPRDSPEAARHGGTEGRPVQLTDIAPAILAGGPLLPPRGRAGGERAMAASVDCFCWREHPQFHGKAAQAVIQGGLEYLDEQGRAPILFDLSDPMHIASGRPDDAGRLAHELQQWRAALAGGPTPSGGRNAERDEALAALGYIE